MKLSPQQEKAVAAVRAWFRAPDRPVFRLFGFAGTGKTTLARFIAGELGADAQFAAFTGKAAQVLRSKGAENARTIHSLIYRPKGEEADEETGEATPLFSLNRSSPVARADLVIIDECSMVDEDLGRDLLSFGTPILVLGDPGQLPPVSGGGYFTDHEPDILLTEIHRQARENPIIELADKVRHGENLSYGAYGATRIINRSDLDQDEVLEADQVLVGTNKTRRRYNKRLRELLGYRGLLPSSGDKLVCTRNRSEKGLLNGSIWHVSSVGKRRGDTLSALVKAEDEGVSQKVRLSARAFEDPEGTPYLPRSMDAFDFGYALTVHKAQGSQWDSVMLFDESWAFRDHKKEWLYTAITRAADKLTVVR